MDRRGIECEELKTQVAKLEADKSDLGARQEAVLLERASLADQASKSGKEVEGLNDCVGVL